MPTLHRLSTPVLLLLACGPSNSDDDGTSTASTTEDSPSTPTSSDTGTTTAPDADTDQVAEDGPSPQSTAWQVVVEDHPFPLADITRVTFGRQEFNTNFANRGDIEVLFDRDAEVITIELRKYDFSDAVTFWGDGTPNWVGTAARLRPWAYNQNIASPRAPQSMDPAADCLVDAWKDDCALYLYFDGQSQPVRSGADFRVHLPRAYRGELHVETEDNEHEASYPRRGDVTVTDWCGDGTVVLSAGVAQIHMCRDLSPTPRCPAEQTQQCEAAGWTPDCGCSPTLFGQARVESRQPWAADITLDTPDTLWLSVIASNNAAEPNDCAAALTNCAAPTCTPTADDPQTKSAEYNYPGDTAPPGAGYNLTVQSAGCHDVEFFPDEYAPWDPNTPPQTELRGQLTVCTDCL